MNVKGESNLLSFPFRFCSCPRWTGYSYLHWWGQMLFTQRLICSRNTHRSPRKSVLQATWAPLSPEKLRHKIKYPLRMRNLWITEGCI
jgi:hypothetical protein